MSFGLLSGTCLDWDEPRDQPTEAGQIDPSFIITHRVPLEEAPSAYKTFRDKEDGCIKVVLKPSGQ